MDPTFAINLPKITLAPDVLFHIGPIPITNSNLSMIIVMVFLVLLFFFITRNLQLVPGRKQALGEVTVEGLLGLAVSTSGNRALSRRIFPLAATIFIFVLCSFYFGLLPGVETIYVVKDVPMSADACAKLSPDEMAKENIVKNPDGTCTAMNEKVPLFRSPVADLNMTVGMALIVIVLVQAAGIQSHGLGGYLKELLTPIPLAPLHIIGELARILSLSFRLFGNVFGGEVLVTVMYSLTYVLIPTVFLSLEVFFGAIQALIFTVLTVIYFSLAVAGHGGSDEHEVSAQEAAHLA